MTTNARFPSELPPGIREQLNPKLAALYSQLSPAVRSRIAALVQRALPPGIHPNRLVKYAFLYATAERQARSDAVSEDHAVRSKSELAGEIHGFRSGYRDQAEAKRLYRRGRQARQQIGASLEGLLKKWDGVEQVVQKHRSELPPHLRERFSNESLARPQKLLHDMYRATLLDEENFLSEKSRRHEPSEKAQTYEWWRCCMVRYRGKWNDMHQLALAWRLSKAVDQETFRSIVVQSSRRIKTLRYPFGKAWESALFEKP